MASLLCPVLWNVGPYNRQEQWKWVSVGMDKILPRDGWPVPVRVLSLNNTCLCLCVVNIYILNIPAVLAGLLLAGLNCSKATSFSLGSSTLHSKFTLAGYFRWQLLPFMGDQNLSWEGYKRRCVDRLHPQSFPISSLTCWLFRSIHSIFFPARYVLASANKTSIVLDWTWPSVWHSLCSTQDT